MVTGTVSRESGDNFNSILQFHSAQQGSSGDPGKRGLAGIGSLTLPDFILRDI